MKEYTLYLEAGCPTGRGHAPQWAALTISEGFYGYLLGLQGLCKAHSLNRVVQDAKVQEWAPAEDCEHFGTLDCEIVLDEFSFRHQVHAKYGVDLVETARV